MIIFPSLGIVALLFVMSKRRAKYGIMASPLSFRISPETSGRTDLFLPIAVNFLLMILVQVAEVIRQHQSISDIFFKTVRIRNNVGQQRSFP
jgi:hypothetical protein